MSKTIFKREIGARSVWLPGLLVAALGVSTGAAMAQDAGDSAAQLLQGALTEEEIELLEQARQRRDQLRQMEEDLHMIQQRFNHDRQTFAVQQQRRQMYHERNQDMPYILATVQFGDQWLARLQTPDGVVQTFRSGARLNLYNGTATISEISETGVKVRRRGQVVALMPLPPNGSDGGGGNAQPMPLPENPPPMR